MNDSLIHPDDAVAAALSALRKPAAETVALRDALGRVLAAPVEGRQDQPPFDKSAMDGWAWRRASGPAIPAVPLRPIGTVAAGHVAPGPMGPGQCIRIMTGAPLPSGADAVQRVEWSSERDGLVSFTRAEGADNIIRRGENSRRGDSILAPRVLRAQDLAILAADGRSSAEVAARPVVGVLSTGTELAAPGEALSGAGIYDSNLPQIVAQLGGSPCEVRDLGRVPDDYAATVATIRSAMETCDVLVLSGGVSMGDFDFVPRALVEAGFGTIFHGVAMKPGKPTWFGRNGGRFALGLPGNPVSVFVNVELLLKPLILALSGLAEVPSYLPMPVPEGISRKGSDRVEFLPVRIGPDGARAVRYGGSSALQALAGADGFVRLEIGQEELEPGSVARVRLVR